MTSFADDASLARFTREEGSWASGSAYTIRRQHQPKEPGYLKGPACHACYRPLKDRRATYCSRDCRHAHHRLVGTGVEVA